MEAHHLVELARILPDVKSLAALDITENPIYEIDDVEDESGGQTEDVSGLIALEAAMRYCRQIIEVELPEGGSIEAARLRYKIFLRCFKNIEFLVFIFFFRLVLIFRITLLIRMRAKIPQDLVLEVENGVRQKNRRNFLNHAQKEVVINLKWIEVTVLLEL